MNAEHIRVLRELLQDVVRQIEDGTVDDVQLVGPGELLELGRQLRSRNERHDDAGLVKRIAFAGTLGDLIVHLVVLDVEAGGAGGLMGSLAMMAADLVAVLTLVRGRRSGRREAEPEAGDEECNHRPLWAPYGLAETGLIGKRAQCHSGEQKSNMVATGPAVRTVDLTRFESAD